MRTNHVDNHMLLDFTTISKKYRSDDHECCECGVELAPKKVYSYDDATYCFYCVPKCATCGSTMDACQCDWFDSEGNLKPEYKDKA